MDHAGHVWLAADYHFPSTYSCRVPMSSTSSSLAMPAPGPGTVRLALIRTSVELFGVAYTRDELFPAIRSAEIRIRPPERVAITAQLLRAYKSSPGRSGRIRLAESPVYREFAHATGSMTVHILVPAGHQEPFRVALNAVGYWGQASSLAWCTEVRRAAPHRGECAISLAALRATHSVQELFSCFVSEFRDADVEWEELIPELSCSRPIPIKVELYVWPMVVGERWSGGTVLRRCSLLKNAEFGARAHLPQEF